MKINFVIAALLVGWGSLASAEDSRSAELRCVPNAISTTLRGGFNYGCLDSSDASSPAGATRWFENYSFTTQANGYTQ